MKRNANYEINFASNLIIVTPKFLKAASQIGTAEYSTMTQLRELSMPITVRKITHSQKEKRWSFKRMECFLDNVENSKDYYEDYKALKESCGYMATWKWFKGIFLKNGIPHKTNKDHRIIVLPGTAPQNEVSLQKAS